MSRDISGNINVNTNVIGRIAAGTHGVKEIYSDTTAGWNAKPSYIAKKDVIYVYTDYSVVSGENVPNIKIGDGLAYLIDLPFICSDAITPEQIEFWNSKVSCIINPVDEENLIFYTGLVP